MDGWNEGMKEERKDGRKKGTKAWGGTTHPLVFAALSFSRSFSHSFLPRSFLPSFRPSFPPSILPSIQWRDFSNWRSPTNGQMAKSSLLTSWRSVIPAQPPTGPKYMFPATPFFPVCAQYANMRARLVPGRRAGRKRTRVRAGGDGWKLRNLL